MHDHPPPVTPTFVLLETVFCNCYCICIALEPYSLMDFCKSHNGTQTNKISAECNLQICMPQSACSEYYVVEDAADYSDLAYFAHLL